ncbi:unnamed protein product [Brugia pahangi]|uniref:Aminotran_1_2 domain-containing protein n=1 Tax=Brugia pahangi TaxID=6280 RepID=A0A0N4TGR2_BRUPA|nr:unnamed protein product [Brugia pahangi]
MVAGYFYASHLQMKEPYRIYNTWLGDPTKVILLEKALKVIERDNLLEQMRKVGATMQSELRKIESVNNSMVQNVRGLGTFCAFDMPDGVVRDKFLEIAGNNGI